MPCCVTCPPTDPYLELPIGTEDTGDWYADLTAAQDAINDQTSDCAGYTDVAFDTFTVTNSTNALTMAETTTFPVIVGVWGCFNSVSGDVIEVAFTATATTGTPVIIVTIYDDAWTEIWTDGDTATSGVLTSSALPATGKYYIHCTCASDFLGADLDAEYTVSSGGTMTVNTIVALYDTGGASPSCLYC